MQVCTWCAAGIQEIPAEPSSRSRTPVAPHSGSSRIGTVLNGETVFETVLTSTVIGLTVQFVSFIFLLTIQNGDQLSKKLIFSGLAGLLAGTCAFALIRAWDYLRWSADRCIQCGTPVSQ